MGGKDFFGNISRPFSSIVYGIPHSSEHEILETGEQNGEGWDYEKPNESTTRIETRTGAVEHNNGTGMEAGKPHLVSL